jgi:serine phosphatase RsbU (regulator of sigma subunit)
VCRSGRWLIVVVGLASTAVGQAAARAAPRPPRSIYLDYDLVCRRHVPVDPRMPESVRRIDLGAYELRLRTRIVGTRTGWVRRGAADVGVQELSRVVPFYLAGTLLIAAARVRRVSGRAGTEQRRRLAREADEARGLQRSLLPASPPPVPGLQVASLFQAAHEVSGDFYLFPEAPAGRLHLVLGDVAGKGIAAALTASLAAGFLHAYADSFDDPAALLTGVGRSLRRARGGRTMVATCAAELEADARRLRWCNVGLPPPALRRGDAVIWLTGGGIPLGGLPQVTYRSQEEQLAPGDMLLFYTDGLIEATSPLGEMFGRERLGATLRRLPAGCSAAAALAQLRSEIARFIGDAEPYDDITAVAVRVEG